MDKLLTTSLGGFPLELDDLRWQFEAFESAFKALWNGLDKAFILTGCEVTQTGMSTYDIEPGAVVLGGEVWLYAGQVGITITNLSHAYFVPNVDYDAAGEEVFEDTNTYQTYQRRRAVVVEADPAPVGDKILVSGQSLGEVLFSLTLGTTIDFIDVSLANGWVNAGPPWARAQYRKEPGGVIRLQGLVNGQSSSSAVVGQLPSGYRPPTTLRAVLGSVVLPSRHVIAQIDTNGFVSIVTPGTPDADDQYDLSNLPAFVSA